MYLILTLGTCAGFEYMVQPGMESLGLVPRLLSEYRVETRPWKTSVRIARVFWPANTV